MKVGPWAHPEISISQSRASKGPEVGIPDRVNRCSHNKTTDETDRPIGYFGFKMRKGKVLQRSNETEGGKAKSIGPVLLSKALSPIHTDDDRLSIHNAAAEKRWRLMRE
ncbi:hypothetical protein DdX_09555 [Ditylenchus destructor]|uniref:Uncharacterized protein n=1 Tax=Ditylenchus destructor TaxID=166010 RepID=A0AAD4N623_9BILA|nr:hypothetical protein DdX_09555 [Ditylenchus destructor]